MYTAMALVALTTGNLTTNPAWLDDYSAAQAKVTVAGKPMAVFVGTGKAGWEAAVRDGFDPSVSNLLAEKFVCLYVDASTPKGKTLAANLQVGDRGIVLSDRTGKTQAYSAAGTISRAELNRALVAYADIEVAQKTDAPKAEVKTAPGTAAGVGSAPGGAVITPGPMPGGVMVGPGGAMMAPPPPGYMGGPAMMGGGGWGGSGCGGGGYAAGGCGGGMGHGCCLFGGMGHGGGCGQSSGCATGGCGMGHGGLGGFGGKCCGLLGGMGHGFGGWGGGCGGGMGHGCGGCH
jgi:hypothetical protein